MLQSCEALEHVDRLGGVAYEQLLDGYLNRDAPLIVVDAMESWPVMNTDDFWFDNITQVRFNIVYILSYYFYSFYFCLFLGDSFQNLQIYLFQSKS